MERAPSTQMRQPRGRTTERGLLRRRRRGARPGRPPLRGSGDAGAARRAGGVRAGGAAVARRGTRGARARPALKRSRTRVVTTPDSARTPHGGRADQRPEEALPRPAELVRRGGEPRAPRGAGGRGAAPRREERVGRDLPREELRERVHAAASASSPPRRRRPARGARSRSRHERAARRARALRQRRTSPAALARRSKVGAPSSPSPSRPRRRGPRGAVARRAAVRRIGREANSPVQLRVRTSGAKSSSSALAPALHVAIARRELRRTGEESR